MRCPRCLSCQERLWVDNAIGQLCIQHGVSDRDEDYRSTGWTAFLAAYRNFRPISCFLALCLWTNQRSSRCGKKDPPGSRV